MLWFDVELVISVVFMLGVDVVHIVGGLMVLSLVFVSSLVEGGVWYWFFIDKVSGVLIVLTLWVLFLMVIVGGGSGGGLGKGGKVSMINVCLLLGEVLLLTFLCKSFFGFYIFFELSLIPTLFLILSWGYQPERFQAGMYLIMYTVGASFPLLVGMMMLFFCNGAVSFLSLEWWMPLTSLGGWWIMLMLAFLVKTPIYFVHLWLPKAHVEAPVVGSMVLAGVLLKLGGYGMIRLCVRLQELSSINFSWLCGLVVWGVVVSSVICLRQTDLKALVAYSSVTHMGLVVCGILSNSFLGWYGALVMMLAHGMVSSSLFMLVGCCYELIQSRSVLLTKGLLAVCPLLSFCWFLSLVANMGAPPSANLQGEIMLCMGVLNSSWVLGGPVGFGLFFSVAYCLCVYVATQHGGCFFRVVGGLSGWGKSGVIYHLVPVFVFFLGSEVIFG